MKCKFKWMAIAAFLSLSIVNAQRPITNEDIWKDYSFYPKSVKGINWMNDGQYYTVQEGNKIIKYDITTGEAVSTIFGKEHHPDLAFNDYSFNATEDKIIFRSEVEPVFRRSSLEKTFVFDLNTEELKEVKGDKHSNATLSPDGSMIAFTRDNDLFVVNLSDLSETPITSDGKKNKVINGMSDWVYEEEFSFTKAFEWSPDSKKIAFIRFDESKVKEYNMQLWDQGGLYPVDYRYKYPKAGEDNSQVKVKIHHLANGKTISTNLTEMEDFYIPRILWTQDSDVLSVRIMNRLQNELQLLHVNANTGDSRNILVESSEKYVDLDLTDDLTYLKDGKHFIHSSEKTGYKHLYLYDINGNLLNPITTGEYEVADVLSIDEKNKTIYYRSTEDSPLERHIYKIGFNGKKKTKLSSTPGTHSANFSPDSKYYIATFSSVGNPPEYVLREGKKGNEIRLIENNEAFVKSLEKFEISPKEFFTFENSSGVQLNGWMIKPSDFEENKKYPVLMYVYGGPGSQTVINTSFSSNDYWYQSLASKGYIIVSIDNRGTGARGTAFRQDTYAMMGKLEYEDQRDGALYLKSLPYVDSERIGIWGWSYGGYMSSLCLFLGGDVFKTAIAVAPVTNWRFYDTIYTERYQKKPQDNPEGYDAYSPLSHVDKLGEDNKYLLIHGTGDDNVHFQNAVRLQNALIDANKQFQSFYYPNRNHGIYGGNTRLHLYNMMTEFLINNL